MTLNVRSWLVFSYVPVNRLLCFFFLRFFCVRDGRKVTVLYFSYVHSQASLNRAVNVDNFLFVRDFPVVSGTFRLY